MPINVPRRPLKENQQKLLRFSGHSQVFHFSIELEGRMTKALTEGHNQNFTLNNLQFRNS